MNLGGPCGICGLPQNMRIQSCTRSRKECPYGNDRDEELISMVAQLAPKPTPTRLARMLKLYIATVDDLSQKQIADECGMSESTLCRFLSGERQPDGRAFFRLLAWCFDNHSGEKP